MNLAKENKQLKLPWDCNFQKYCYCGTFRITKRILSIFQNKTEVQIFIWTPLISLRHKQHFCEPRLACGPLIMISIKTGYCLCINYRTKRKMYLILRTF